MAMVKVSAVLAMVGLCGAASAATTVNVLVSTNGVDFSNSVNPVWSAGLQRVEVLVTVSNTGTAALGLGSFIFQPTISNWQPTDALVPFTSAFGGNTTTPSGAVSDSPGAYGRISPWAAAANQSSSRLFGHVHLTSGGVNQPPSGTYLRIAQAQVTSWIGGTGNTSGGSGVNISQRSNNGRTASDPAFNPSLINLRVFRFAVDVDTNQGFRSLVIDVPLSGMGNKVTTGGSEGQVFWFADMNEPSGSIREVPTVNTAVINFIPAPAGAALLGMGVVAVGRRRRRG